MASDYKLMTPIRNTIANKFQDKKQKKYWREREEKEILMISVCATEKQNLWNLDSGCSKHMTIDLKKSIKLKDNKRKVTFGDNMSSKIIGKGTNFVNNKIKVENVSLV